MPRNKINQDFHSTALKGFRIIKLTCDRFYNKKKSCSFYGVLLFLSSHPNVKKSSKPRTLQDTFNDLLSSIQKPLGIHHIRTILFSLPVNYLNDLRDFGLDKGGVDPCSPKYRLSSIICDVASVRLFKAVRSEPQRFLYTRK
jgi:hypothetical protein